MAKSKGKGSLFTWRCVVVIAAVVVYAAAVALVPRTLIEWKIPFGGAALVSAVVGAFSWKIWRWFTTSPRFIWNFIVAVTAFTGVFTALFYIVNYTNADTLTRHEEKAEVERVYTKVRHHTRRVGRNRYVQGDPYNVFFMQVKMSNGMSKELEIPYDRFRRIRTGSMVSLPVAKGCFGVPVILYR